MPDNNQNPFQKDEDKNKPNQPNGFNKPNNKPKRHAQGQANKERYEQASSMRRQNFKRGLGARPQARPEQSVKPINPFNLNHKSEAKPQPKPEVKPQLKPEQKPQPRPEVKPESVKPLNPFAAHGKPESKPEPAKPEPVKPEPKMELKPEIKVEPKPQPQQQPVNPFLNNIPPKKEEVKEVKKPADIVNPFVDFGAPLKKEEKKPDVVEAEIVQSRQAPKEDKARKEPPQEAREESFAAQGKEGKESIEGGKPIHDFSTTAASESGSSSIKLPGGGFKEEMLGILQQAGLSVKKLITIGVVGLVVVLFFVFGGYGFVVNLFSGDGGSGKTPVTPQESGTNSGVVTSFIFGLEYSKGNYLFVGSLSGVRAAFAVGDTFYAANSFVYYMEILRRMQNIYDTDVYTLLNKSLDRRATLEAHLAEMDVLMNEAQAAYDAIGSQLTGLSDKYTVLTEKQNSDEAIFFNSLFDLQGESSYQYLDSFVDSSQKAVKTKAYHNAYAYIYTMLNNSLVYLRPRYQDIYSNKEAVIKGMHVFQFPNSDIKAIIRVTPE